MSQTIGGYLTKNGNCDCGWGTILRVSQVAGEHSGLTLPRPECDVTGYYCSEHQDEMFVPCVAELPHGKLLAGYTMGEGMSTSFDAETIYTDEREAWVGAHRFADVCAEAEREYQASRCCECDSERMNCGEFPQYCETCADFYADEEEGETHELALHATT